MRSQKVMRKVFGELMDCVSAHTATASRSAHVQGPLQHSILMLVHVVVVVRVRAPALVTAAAAATVVAAAEPAAAMSVSAVAANAATGGEGQVESVPCGGNMYVLHVKRTPCNSWEIWEISARAQ